MKEYREDELVRVMQVVLERQRFTMEKQINLAQAVRRGRLELVPDIIADEAGRMIMRLDVDVWGQKVQDEEVTLEASFSRSWPATWWQAFKSQYFPAWALRRWPVRLHTSSETQTKRFKFKTVALLPNFRYDPPPDADGRYVLGSYVMPEATRTFPGRKP
jgi:hypothetical protein